MNKNFTLLILASLVLGYPTTQNRLFAATPPASPIATTGTSIVAPDWRASIVADWKTPTTFGRVETSADGLKLITTEQPQHVYSLQTRLLNRVPLSKGDTLFIRFAARSRLADKWTGVTKLSVNFGKSSPDWDSSYKGEIGLSSEWQRFDIPFTCKNDFAVGEAHMTFTFGYPTQEAEVADLQVLRFGPEVSPASLPRTKRYADKIAPEVVQRELARIVTQKRELAAVKDPSPANGRVIHVAKTGTATGTGTPLEPFASITQALAVVKPGDTIEVGAGEYGEPKGISVRTSGRPDAWIHIKAAPGTRPKLITSDWSGFALSGGIGYVEIDGFELEWVAAPAVRGANGGDVHGSGVAPMYGSHHIRILNNVIHGYGTGGICSLDCDYLHIEGNRIYNTAKTSPFGGSAISLCRAFNFDENPGYHNIVRGNICYDNELKVVTQASSGGNGRTLTDGNGIIIDVFNRSRANPLIPHGQDKDGPLIPYRHRTLVENNLIYDNGGRGIHVFRSNKVDVINNTTYMNQKSRDVNGGELTAIESVEVVLANNIAYSQKGKSANSQNGSSRVIWVNNLIHNSEDLLIHQGLIQADPQFIAAAPTAKPEGFGLKPSSPARGKALIAIAPTFDLSGTRRLNKGSINLGAF